eukprot:scaffold622_cov335-Pavlova_lutheri.AAC.29
MRSAAKCDDVDHPRFVHPRLEGEGRSHPVTLPWNRFDPSQEPGSRSGGNRGGGRRWGKPPGGGGGRSGTSTDRPRTSTVVLARERTGMIEPRDALQLCTYEDRIGEIRMAHPSSRPGPNASSQTGWRRRALQSDTLCRIDANAGGPIELTQKGGDGQTYLECWRE